MVTPTTIKDFAPTQSVLTLTRDWVQQMTGGDFRRTFAHSAIARLRYKTLLRNSLMCDDSQDSQN